MPVRVWKACQTTVDPRENRRHRRRQRRHGSVANRAPRYHDPDPDIDIMHASCANLLSGNYRTARILRLAVSKCVTSSFVPGTILMRR